MTTNAEAAVLVAALLTPPTGAAGGSTAQAAAIATEVAAWLASPSVGGSGAVKTCTFTDTGDLVGAVAHGYVAGDIVVFDTVVTTTGVTALAEYYVIASGLTADAFKVSTTSGGSAATLTTDGTGTVHKRAFTQAKGVNGLMTAAQAMAGQARRFKEVGDYAAVIAGRL